MRRRQRALQRGGPGRWSLLQSLEAVDATELTERTARLFLHRYGIVFRDVWWREKV